MRNFFNLDNPFMVFMSNLTDIIILNVVCILCCLPVVTIGATVTAMHYVTLKMVKDEEGYLLKGFWKSFKENFRQATVIWLIFLAITAIFYIDFRAFSSMETDTLQIKGLKVIIYTMYLLVCLTMMYAFPVLSRFTNTTAGTLKNAFLMSLLHIGRTILMAVIYLLPYILLPLHTTMIPVFLMIGLTGPAYLNSYLWKGIFKKYEPEEAPEDEEALSGENSTDNDQV